ncbi:MAG: NAD(P)/FAD-dependent oxidoreductase [Myxococcales bacterium]|nr:NAD(P)/FAD-dependent oxidoreductase [Myxococcales bacterium]
MTQTPAGNQLPRVVIIGGGFAGIHAAKALRRAPVEVVVIDKNNHHVFQPLLYQVATAGLAAVDIATPIRAILRKQKNARVIMSEVRDIDRSRRAVLLEHEEITYDYLILAAGMVTNFFGHDEWRDVAPSLKDLHDALAMRRRILSAFEAAELASDPEEVKALLTFVIVGAGPTGVELAGAIREIAGQVMVHDFRRIDPKLTRVIMVEAAPRVLPPFPEILSAKAQQALEKLGVEIRLQTIVKNITPEGVQVGDEFVPSRTVLWTAGVAASPLTKSLGLPLDRAGRVLVNEDLTAPDDPRVFVAGDLAHFEIGGQPPLPGLAAVAMQEGDHAALNIRLDVAGKARRPFHYLDRGKMATIGRYRAVAEVFGVRFAGWPAWLAWLFVHVLFLIGFRNRFSVLVQWAYSYLAVRRCARLILKP